jgi:hypothetical protein
LEPSDREAAPEDQEGSEAPGDGGCRLVRGSTNGAENFWRLAVLDALPELPAISEGGAEAEDREWAWSSREGGCYRCSEKCTKKFHITPTVHIIWTSSGVCARFPDLKAVKKYI